MITVVEALNLTHGALVLTAAYPKKRGLGKWGVESAMQVLADAGQRFSKRDGFVVQRTDDHVYWAQSEDMARAVAEALNFVEAGSG